MTKDRSPPQLPNDSKPAEKVRYDQFGVEANWDVNPLFSDVVREATEWQPQIEEEIRERNYQ